MKPFIFSIAFIASAALLFAQNQMPVLTNMTGATDVAAKKFTVNFDLADAENDSLEIKLELSATSGASFDLNSLLQTGDFGFPIFAKTGHQIIVDLAALPDPLPANLVARLTVLDRQPLDIQALVNEVDSNRMKSQLQFIEGIRHRTAGLPHLNAVRDSILDFFSEQCFFLKTQSFPYSNTTGKNLIGKQFGHAQPNKTVVIDAHYDTVANSPGADDNGSGTVGMLEAALVLGHLPCKNSLNYVAFDLEETGLTGSTAFNGPTGGILPTEEVEAVFNFEMIGFYSEKVNSQTLPNGFSLIFPVASAQVSADSFRGNFITNVSNINSSLLGGLFKTAAAQFVPSLKVVHVDIPGVWNSPAYQDLLRSDHAAFWVKNRPALMLTDGANFRNGCYHTACDTATEKLNFQFMSNVVKATVATAAQIAGVEHGATMTINCPISPVISTKNGSPGGGCEFDLFPNPACREIYLRLADCPAKMLQFDLLDLAGKMVRSARFEAPFFADEIISLDGLAAGNYLIRLRDGVGERTERLLVR